MDVEAIEYNGKIIGIECEMMGLVGGGNSIDHLIELVEDLDEGFIMW